MWLSEARDEARRLQGGSGSGSGSGVSTVVGMQIPVASADEADSVFAGLQAVVMNQTVLSALSGPTGDASQVEWLAGNPEASFTARNPYAEADADDDDGGSGLSDAIIVLIACGAVLVAIVLGVLMMSCCCGVSCCCPTKAAAPAGEAVDKGKAEPGASSATPSLMTNVSGGVSGFGAGGNHEASQV